MHAGSFESGTDHAFAASFYHPRRGAQALGLEFRIAQALPIAPQILHAVVRPLGVGGVAAKSAQEILPATLIQFLVSPLGPARRFCARLAVKALGHLAEALLDVEAIHDLNGLGEQLPSQIPDPGGS